VIFEQEVKTVMSQLCAGDVKACRRQWQRRPSALERAGAAMIVGRLPQAAYFSESAAGLTLIEAGRCRRRISPIQGTSAVRKLRQLVTNLPVRGTSM